MKFNYKKSLLSVAAASAIAVTSLSADYVTLADYDGATKSEEKWVLFGVTGLKTTGAGAGTSAGTFSITDSTANVATDEVLDDSYVEGMLTATSDSLARVKVLAPLSYVEVRVDTTGAVYNETEPVRTMYVTMTEGGGAAFAFTYRASLEGQTMQYSINPDNSDAHTVTINAANTYDNPAFGEVIQEVAGLDGSSLNKLADVADYDFSDNPVNSSYYDEVTNQQQATDPVTEYVRTYSYDAATQTWKLYDSRNTDEANDFDTLEKGKAYWAKMNNDDLKDGGLVLGSSSITAAEYAAAGITDGWNLMSFGNANPYIRKSNTGLIIKVDGVAAINIYDASGNHMVSPDVTNADDKASCRAINQAIKAAKVQGSFPADFDLRAYISGTANELILLSNKRFLVDDPNTIVSTVTTLTGAKPFLVSDAANPIDPDDTTIVADLSTTAGPLGQTIAMSKYGEYAMVIEPLVVAGTAAELDAGKIHVQNAADDATTATAFSIDNAVVGAGVLSDTVAAITANSDIGGTTAVANELDINLDGTTDSVIIASTKPFYIRDHTFTRVFKYTDTATTGDAYIKGTGLDATVSLLNTTADSVAAATVFSGNGNVVAADDPANTTVNFVIISDATDANEFTITEATTTDHLTDATTSSDLAKGAVKGVYSLSNLSTADLENTIASLVADGLTVQDHTTDTLGVSITTLNGTFTDTTTDLGTILGISVAGAVTQTQFTGAIKTRIEALLNAKGIQYTSVTATDADPSEITIVSSEITSFTVTAVDVDGAAAANDATVVTTASTFIGVPSVTPDLSKDLKFNAIYSPNYVTDGPLYTMKQSGFTLKALVTGSTDLTDGSVNWDSVDLTRIPSEWLDSQDYNLFQTDQSSGYWAFLEADTGTNALAISNATLKPLTYTYHFNAEGANSTAVNYNAVSGNIALTIDGLDTDVRAIPVVTTTIAGSTVELANIAGSNIYTGKMSSYEIENMTRGYEYEILANVADGLGYNLISQNIGLKVDLQKPTTPTINLDDPTAVAFSSDSADVAGYYVFNGQIPEVDTVNATTLLAKLTAAEAAAYGLCGAVDALAWDAPAYDLNVIAIDGEGLLGLGNVSDTAVKSYVPMLQNSVLLENVNQADGTLVSTTEGDTHDALCASTGPQTVNYGVSVTAMTDFKTVKLAYTPQNITDTQATGITLYVTGTTNAGGDVAEINYAKAYAGDKVYVEVGGAVYSLVLPTEDEISSAADYTGADEGSTNGNPLDLDLGVFATFYTGQNL